MLIGAIFIRVKELKREGNKPPDSILSDYDQLSEQLFLPRQSNNTKKIAVNNSKSPQPALKNNFIAKQPYKSSIGIIRRKLRSEHEP